MAGVEVAVGVELDGLEAGLMLYCILDALGEGEMKSLMLRVWGKHGVLGGVGLVGEEDDRPLFCWML